MARTKLSTSYKSLIKDRVIKLLFKRRSERAKEEYYEVVANTKNEFCMVNYRNILMNPLEIPPRKMTCVLEVQEGSKEAIALDRIVRVHEERAKTLAIITYILNFVESYHEFWFLYDNTDSPEISEERKEALLSFKEEITDKLSYIKRMKLLAKMVK